jgi:SAM-dependent methyltransferase
VSNSAFIDEHLIWSWWLRKVPPNSATNYVSAGTQILAVHKVPGIVENLVTALFLYYQECRVRPAKRGGIVMSRKDHWETIYSNRATEQLGWYELHLETSMDWVQDLGLSPDTPILDVGCGVSTFVDDLLRAGCRSITVLDISQNALSSVRGRLGKKSDSVTWINGDVTSIELPPDYYGLWHDRAVFHFLTTPDQQMTYRDQLSGSLKDGGNLIIGTFALEAPPKCSGLPVQRYSPGQLALTLGEDFQLIRHRKKLHITPAGTEQMYLFCHFRKRLDETRQQIMFR